MLRLSTCILLPQGILPLVLEDFAEVKKLFPAAWSQINFLQPHKIIESGPQGKQQRDIKDNAAQVMQKRERQKTEWENQYA